jgi:hypothetical protein
MNFAVSIALPCGLICDRDHKISLSRHAHTRAEPAQNRTPFAVKKKPELPFSVLSCLSGMIGNICSLSCLCGMMAQEFVKNVDCHPLPTFAISLVPLAVDVVDKPL